MAKGRWLLRYPRRWMELPLATAHWLAGHRKPVKRKAPYILQMETASFTYFPDSSSFVTETNPPRNLWKIAESFPGSVPILRAVRNAPGHPSSRSCGETVHKEGHKYSPTPGSRSFTMRFCPPHPFYQESLCSPQCGLVNRMQARWCCRTS